MSRQRVLLDAALHQFDQFCWYLCREEWGCLGAGWDLRRACEAHAAMLACFDS